METETKSIYIAGGCVTRESLAVSFFPSFSHNRHSVVVFKETNDACVVPITTTRSGA